MLPLPNSSRGSRQDLEDLLPRGFLFWLESLARLKLNNPSAPELDINYVEVDSVKREETRTLPIHLACLRVVGGLAIPPVGRNILQDGVGVKEVIWEADRRRFNFSVGHVLSTICK